jgi:hypothetical protein
MWVKLEHDMLAYVEVEANPKAKTPVSPDTLSHETA